MRHGHTGVFEQVPVSPFVYKCGLDVHMRTMCGAEMVASASSSRISTSRTWAIPLQCRSGQVSRCFIADSLRFGRDKRIFLMYLSEVTEYDDTVAPSRFSQLKMVYYAIAA